MAYPSLSPDTSPEAEAIQLEIYRQMPGWRKIELVFEANALNRALAMAGLRNRYPKARPSELRRRLMSLLLGEELAARAYGPLEDSL